MCRPQLDPHAWQQANQRLVADSFSCASPASPFSASLEWNSAVVVPVLPLLALRVAVLGAPRSPRECVDALRSDVGSAWGLGTPSPMLSEEPSGADSVICNADAGFLPVCCAKKKQPPISPGSTAPNPTNSFKETAAVGCLVSGLYKQLQANCNGLLPRNCWLTSSVWSSLKPHCFIASLMLELGKGSFGSFIAF